MEERNQPKNPNDQQNQPHGPHTFLIGSSVEIRHKKTWFEATIAQTPKSTNQDMYKVKYSTATQEVMNDLVCSSMIRPPSPCICDMNAVFDLFQEVEAFHNGGWRSGVIKNNRSLNNGVPCYCVVFPVSRKEFIFRADELRNKMEWDNGNWVSVDQHSQKGQHVMFHEGIQVEIRRDTKNYGASWFIGTIQNIIGKTYFLVQYKSIILDSNDCTNSPLKEIVDVQYIRPCPPVTKSTSFKVLEEVEAFHEGGWIFGVITMILSMSRYMVKFLKNYEVNTTVFSRNLLRHPLVWSDGRWKCISKGMEAMGLSVKTGVQLTHPYKRLKTDKKVEEKPSIPRNSKNVPRSCKSKRNSPAANLISSSVKQPDQTEVSHVLPQKGSSIPCAKSYENSLIQNLFPGTCNSVKKHIPSVEDAVVVDHNEPVPCESQVNPFLTVSSLFEENNAPNWLSSENATEGEIPKANESLHCSMNGVAAQSVVTPHGILLPSNGDIGDHDKFLHSLVVKCANEHVDNGRERENIAQRSTEFALDKTQSDTDDLKDCETSLIHRSPISEKFESPFTINKKSELRELAESTTKVLHIFPQEPHFQPLLKHGKDLQEGLACGLSMAFANLVTNIKNLTISVSETDLKEKLRALEFLEEYGFDTQPVRARLEKLLELRSMLYELEGKKNSADAKVEELEEEEVRDNLFLAEIEESLAHLKEKRTAVTTQMRKNHSEIASLEQVVLAAEQERVHAIQEFDASLTAPW